MYKAGKRDGFGLIKLACGTQYEGSFKNDKLDGQGVYQWADGSEYKG